MILKKRSEVVAADFVMTDIGMVSARSAVGYAYLLELPASRVVAVAEGNEWCFGTERITVMLVKQLANANKEIARLTEELEKTRLWMIQV